MAFWRRKPEQAEEIGPDGMTDYARELHDLWRRGDEARRGIYKRAAERTGLDVDVIEHLRDADLMMALILGRSDG